MSSGRIGWVLAAAVAAFLLGASAAFGQGGGPAGDAEAAAAPEPSSPAEPASARGEGVGTEAANREDGKEAEAGQQVDTQAAVAAGFTRSPSKNNTYTTFGFELKPISNIVLKVDHMWVSNAVDDRPLGDELAIQRAIRPIAGATLTTQAVNAAVRRVLALDQVLEGYGPAANGLGAP